MMRLSRALLIAAPVVFAVTGARAAPLPIRVVVVTTFELGQDSGDMPGEFQNWVEKLPLATVLAFPQGTHPLRYNARLHVLGLVSGEGPARMAASITALGTDPRFDLSHAYFVLAGIAGIDPRIGSVGSAAWAKHVISGDGFEIDAREMPAGWPTGIVPFQRTTPYQQPAPPAQSIWGTAVTTLNAGLVDWAYGLTRNTVLPDSPGLHALRVRYTDSPAARRPPMVLEGDTLSSGMFWIGWKMNDWAEQWTRYWTHGTGTFATTAEEDAGLMQALTFLAQVHRVDLARVLVLRTASDYDAPPPGETAAALLASEGTETGFAAYRASLDAAYAVGSTVVRYLATHWSSTRDHIP